MGWLNGNAGTSEILQAKILKWVAIPPQRSSQSGDQTSVSYVYRTLAGGFFTTGTTGKPTHQETETEKKKEKKITSVSVDLKNTDLLPAGGNVKWSSP